MEVVVRGYITGVTDTSLWANNWIEREDIELAYVAQARILHLTSFVDEKQLAVQEWLVGDIPPQVWVSFVPGSIYARRGAEALSTFLRRTAFLFVNEDEAKDLGLVCSLFDRGCQVVVIALGEKGCRVLKLQPPVTLRKII